MGTIRKPDTPEKAIRLKCLECCCGAAAEVENCNLSGCPLFEYRMYGAKPTEKKEPTTGDLVVETDSSKIAVSSENAKLEVVVKNPKVVSPKPSKRKSSKAKAPDEIIEPISKVDTGTGTICGEPVIVGETVTPVPVKNEDESIDWDLDIDDIDNEPVEIEPSHKKTDDKPAKKDEQDLELDDVPDVEMAEIDIDEPAVESKPPIEDGHKFVVDLDKVERKEEPAPKKKKQTKKKYPDEIFVDEKATPDNIVMTAEEASKKTEKEQAQESLDDIDIDELFDM